MTLAGQWDGADFDILIALHGTDLYRDIHTDASAQRSLQLPSQLLVLQPAGLQELDLDMRAKARVIYQSAPALKPISGELKRNARYFNVIMIGHFRDEKDPATFMQAAKQINSTRVRLIHIGRALDPLLGELAEATQAANPNYHWLGNIKHATTRQHLKRSHLMVITSKMEGGANVIVEAITSGVPVLASDISGNQGMLGENYPDYFPRGQSNKLAELIDRAATDTAFYAQLQAQCLARKHLFEPELERAAVRHLVHNCLLQK